MPNAGASHRRRARGWMLAILFVLLVGLGGRPAAGQGLGAITGTVVAEGGPALVGAEVVLRERGDPTVVVETKTGTSGTFQIAEVPPGRYLLEVRYLGYEERAIPMVLEMGESRDVDVALTHDPTSLETTVVAASRKRQDLLTAPASVSILGAERIRREATTSSVEALRSIPGVDVAQTGIDRRELALRGFNGAAFGGPHVLVDHRETATPALGLNLFSMMPNTALDLERIEAVRGPAAALYGPEASGGVLHFITKSPFQDPGTSLAVSGGSRSYMNAQFRQAGVLDGTVGYKFTGQWGRADEWPLNTSTPKGAAEQARYRVYDDPDAPELADRSFVVRDVDGDGDPDAQLVREDLYRRYNANGLLTYRFDRETWLMLRGGYATLTSPLQSSVGTLQASDFAYSYGQLRLEAGDLTAQLTLNRNLAGGDVYRYSTGRSVPSEGTQLDARFQYDVELDAIDTEVQFGAEADRTTLEVTGADVQPTDDDVQTMGAFLQTTTALGSSLSLSAAGRADYRSFHEDVVFAPRAALVYTPTSTQSLRASYNRSVWAPDPFPLRPANSGDLRVGPQASTTTETVEAGYKGQIADRLRIDLAGYYEHRDNVFVPTQTGTYRNAGTVDYFGIDLEGELRATSSLSLFGNASLVSEESFDGSGVNDAPSSEVVLNAPAFKIRGGVDYGLPASVTIGATVHHVDDFPVRYGPYAGTVDSYTVMDVRLRAPIPSVRGLSVNLTAKNILGTEHREFVGAPELGRMIIGRLTYELP